MLVLMQFTVSAQTLVNRYSFNDTDNGAGNVGAAIADSVGGASGNGVLPNGGDLASVPGQLILSAASQQYVQLPAGVLSNYTAVTIDAWVTTQTLPTYCFFWGFGNTDSGGYGANYLFGSLARQYVAIAGVDPGYTAEQGTAGGANLSGVTVHFTTVCNPAAGYIALYTNGVLQSINKGVTTPLSSVQDVYSYIGKSLYNGDPYGDMQLDEFRIWNGALNDLQVAGTDVAGPGTVSTAYGTVTGLQLQLPFFQLTQGGNEAPVVIAQASLVPYTVDISRIATLSSGNTNVIKINGTNNTIVAVGQGSANVIATYGSVSATQTVTVVQPVSVLVHRYSFSDTDDGNGNYGASVADSVGGAAWNGTLPNGGAFTGSQLQLTASGVQYVQLPAGVISNYSALTIDAWASFPSTLPGNCFFWGFGNTDNSGLGASYIYLQPSAGHIGITGSDPGYTSEQQAGGYGNLSLRNNVHITAVFNPQVNWIAVYTNGVLTGKNLAVTWQMNQVSSALNYIARSLYNDPYMDVNMDEFRIYNGALTSQGIAISDAAGPDSIPAAVTNGPGALLSLTIQAPATLETLQVGSLKLLANYASLANWDIIGNSIFAPAGLTISTTDTNVLVYGTDGKLHGVNAGTASVVTVYQGITNTASITVTQSVAPTLVHRYSFTSDASDSVGGANGTLNGSASISGGQVVLNGTSGTYVSLPGGVISNYSAVTIEGWATFGTSPVNTFLFGFGNTDAGNAGANYLFGSPFGTGSASRFAITGSDPGYVSEQAVSSGVNWNGQANLHFTAVCDPPAGYVAIYTNGVLAGINNAVTTPLTSVSNVFSYIGKSLYSADPYCNVSVDEFRIYNGALSPNDVKTTQALGANLVLTNTVRLTAAVSGGNLVLSWPVAGGAFTVQSKASLTSGAWTTVSSPPAQLAGSQWQVTLPKAGSAQFFRLAR